MAWTLWLISDKQMTGYMCVYQVITLYTLYYNFICQLYLNKAEKKCVVQLEKRTYQKALYIARVSTVL